jgi:hypothetical protein
MSLWQCYTSTGLWHVAACDQRGHSTCKSQGLQADYEKQMTEVGEGLAALQKYADQISDMHGALDARSTKTGGGAGPVARMRAAVAALKDEMKAMDVKIGVTRQQLLHVHRKRHLETGG